MTKSHILGLTLAVCCILATCSQARRISHRHDVVGPPEGAALDTSGWRPVMDSGRPKLEQVAVSPTGYDGDSELVPPPRRNPSLKVKKNRPHLKGVVASETRSSTAFTLPPQDVSSKRPMRFPDEKRRPIRRHRPGSVHLRPYLAQESSQQHVRFRPSPPAPDNIWSEPTEPSVGYFTPQHYNEGPLHLAITPQEKHQLISTQQVFGNPALFNLEQPVRRPQNNAFLEPAIHENEVLQGIVPHREEVPKYQITDPSSPPPRRRRPRPPATEETPYIEPEMHRSPAVHEAPAWPTEPSVRPRRPKPTAEEPWRNPEEVQGEEEQERRRPNRPPAPVQEQLEDDYERPAFQMRPRKPIAVPPFDEQSHQEERVTLRPRRPRPPVTQVVQEDLEQEVSSPRPQQEEERPLKRRRPRPPGEFGAQRRRRPKPRPQAVAPVEEEEQQQQQQQQQQEEERNVHRQPIQNWPTKESTTEEAVTPENYPEIQQDNYPQVDEIPQQHQHHQQQQHHQHQDENYPEEQPSHQQVEEVPYQESNEESHEQQPVSEEVNHKEPNEVTSTEPLFSIPPKRKRPEVTTPETVVTTTVPSTTSTTTEMSTTTSVISNRLRAKLNQTRPRFSLNNIKERLRQQQSEQQKDEQPANTESPKSRFKLGTSSTTEAPTTERSTFRPSMGRFTRPPFNSRYRSTTETPPAVATTTEFVATRRANPDLYSQNKERRPSLRRRTTEAPVTTTEEMEEEEGDKELESTTEEMMEMTTNIPVSSTTPEDFSYARRVTDLTSSATAFNPLSFFSAVPANGKHASQLRFTMATEDPILPIEAFFPAFTSKPAKPHGE